MKRVILIFLILLITIPLLAACSSTNHVNNNANTYLDDFDYMMQTMEETFPYFGVAERKLGIDIKALGQETRSMIENYPSSMEDYALALGIASDEMPPLDEHIFASIVRHEFFSKFTPFAHSMALNFNDYLFYGRVYSSKTHETYLPDAYNAFSNDRTKRFYEENRALYDELKASGDERILKFIFRGDEPMEIAERWPTSYLIQTDIIEDNKVAYLKIASFMNFSPNAVSDKLRKFYRDTRTYDHLIIDIRDNFGGSVDFWRMFVMNPLWKNRDEMPDMTLYAFYNNSKLAKKLADTGFVIEKMDSRYKPESDTVVGFDELLDGEALEQLNEDDQKTFAYGVKYSTSLKNIDYRHTMQIGFPNMIETPFEGKIWLLTNKQNYSAAALFARHAKEMGFATLVGEPTGGAYSAFVGGYFALPNTGLVLRWDVDYLTDSEGRALNEFPTTPHYEVMPGLDALETTLRLIREN